MIARYTFGLYLDDLYPDGHLRQARVNALREVQSAGRGCARSLGGRRGVVGKIENRFFGVEVFQLLCEYLQAAHNGTLVLKSSFEKPRAVSLLPRVHLAIVRPEMLRADMHQVFTESKNDNYLVFITGPSRTADIELTVTLGVHGPKNLYVWVIGK
jgi:LUD domain